jgi:reverse gyrase
MMRDFEERETKLISELAGPESNGLPEIDIPELLLVAEADATQMRIVARAVAGQSFAVETLPGCGYVQTVINVLAGLVAQDKRVLVVAPRRQTINELAERLGDLGLAGLAVRSNSTWVDVIAAISRNEKAADLHIDDSRAERISAEQTLDQYFDSLNRIDPMLGVSA